MIQPKYQNEFFRCFFSHRTALIGVGVFSFVVNLLLLTPAIYMLQTYDRVLSSRNVTTLVVLTVLMIGLYMIMGLLEKYRSAVLVRVGNAMDLALSPRIFQASFERNLKYGGGNPSQAMTDLSHLRQFFTGNGLFTFLDAPWFPIYLFVIFLFHNWLGWFSVLGSLALVLINILSERTARQPLDEANTASILSHQYMNSSFRNAPSIQAMGMISSFNRRWFELQSLSLEKQSRASDAAGTSMAFAKFLKLVMQSGVLGLGAYLVLRDEISAGMMIAASILMGRALAPIEALIGSWKGFINARISLRRLGELLDEFPKREKGLALPKPEGYLEADNVYVNAPSNTNPILSGLTFKLNPGEVVGVVGPSASGKSSLAKVMVGIWPTSHGRMTLDGSDIFLWDKEELGPYIGYLPQEVELFDGTVAENISRFGQLDSGKIIEASKSAGVHEMILSFPKGYDTIIGERSQFVLSAGQRQRLALARAMYGSPSLLVLDEPNSNLDDTGESTLVQALMEFKMRGHTSIVITHRMGVLKAVDRLMLMQNGKLKIIGPRDEVLMSLRSNRSND